MTLSEATTIQNQPRAADAQSKKLVLLCGFTPLHLQTFMEAYGRKRFPSDGVAIATGRYGDLAGNLERACEGPPAEAAVVLEWFDLDARLGMRHTGGWGSEVLNDILREAHLSLDRIVSALERLAKRGPVALCPPTLALPPVGHTIRAQATAFELRLQQELSVFLCTAAGIPSVRIVSRQRLDEISPAAGRFDLKLELVGGVPYRVAHADAVARLIIDVLYPAPPKKGIITDLDGTLWRGILGEAGVNGVSWDLASGAQLHGLYQQFLAALGEHGVLLAVASKNEPAAVAEAFRRKDLLLAESAVFPIEAGWGAKSESVARILRAWNVGADSVVFIDDSPMELAEVQARFPEIECIRFPGNDPAAFWEHLERLRDLCGKPALAEEDRFRLASLRTAEALRSPDRAAEAPAEFLKRAGGKITIDFRKNAEDARTLELINKTNQFNLNGRRYTESEWRRQIECPSTFVLTVSYEDKFGPLGKIAVLAGTLAQGVCTVETWVMSCRAFSRHIEHHVLDRVFTHFGVAEVHMAYCRTERNGPLQQFLSGFAALDDGAGGCRVSHDRFQETTPALPHEVIEISNG